MHNCGNPEGEPVEVLDDALRAWELILKFIEIGQEIEGKIYAKFAEIFGALKTFSFSEELLNSLKNLTTLLEQVGNYSPEVPYEEKKKLLELGKNILCSIKLIPVIEQTSHLTEVLSKHLTYIKEYLVSCGDESFLFAGCNGCTNRFCERNFDWE